MNTRNARNTRKYNGKPRHERLKHDMTITEIAALIKAEFCCGEDLAHNDINTGCASDLMSDVLAYGKENAVLLTGLMNPQVIRTAEMMDIFCIVFVRGKKPSEDMINLAIERSFALLRTEHSMFAACGILHNAGLLDYIQA